MLYLRWYFLKKICLIFRATKELEALGQEVSMLHEQMKMVKYDIQKVDWQILLWWNELHLLQLINISLGGAWNSKFHAISP